MHITATTDISTDVTHKNFIKFPRQNAEIFKTFSNNALFYDFLWVYFIVANKICQWCKCPLSYFPYDARECFNFFGC